MIERLGKNKNCYSGETIDIEKVIGSCIQEAKKHLWEIEILSVPESDDLVVFKKSLETAKKRIYISAGIHGDEPAGPLAILELLSKNEWEDDMEIVIFPCLNPLGFKLNTRENDKCIDLNRDYYNCHSPEICAHVDWLKKESGFDLALCLHEDWDSNGFYLYESLDSKEKSISKKIINAVSEIFPIDMSEEIDGHNARGGVIGAPINHKTENYCPEAIYLFEKMNSENYTLETSSDFPLEARVGAMCVAVKTALGTLII